MIETTPEFSRIVAADRLPPSGFEQTIEANEKERAALARRFNLTELPFLQAELTLTPHRDRSVRVTGKILADIMQACVVTLDPLPGHFDLDVDVTFIPADAAADDDAEAPGEMEDELDHFSNGKIDIGEMTAQYLGVNLDPYPRKPDAALPATEFGPAVSKVQPFAQLAELARNKKNSD
ncbi:MAG: hypothetical protein P4M15_09110 [Alphaproteobacteria bacterium]|nr:hypothetical protein [Alphaproteobacteria bacterium]